MPNYPPATVGGATATTGHRVALSLLCRGLQCIVGMIVGGIKALLSCLPSFFLLARRSFVKSKFTEIPKESFIHTPALHLL